MAITDSDTSVGEVINEVGTQLEDIKSAAERWADATQQALDQTPGEMAPQPPDPPLTLPTKPAGTNFVVPSGPPTRPSTDFADPKAPRAYDVRNLDRFSKPRDPTYSVNFGDVFQTYEPGPKPDLPHYDAPTVFVPDLLPPDPVVAPDRVELSRAGIPTFGGLTLPSFAISINPANLPALQDKFDFQDDPFRPEILDEIKAEVRRVLGGQMLIPQWVWDGIWSHAAGNLKRQELAAVREAQRAGAAAGWMMPGPVMLAREEAARTKAHEAISELTHTSTTKQTELVREDLWKAIETGLAIETLLERVHAQAQERALKVSIEGNNAAIAVYNAALQAYQVTEIGAKELLAKLKDLELRGSLAELQIFESEIKAAGLALDYDRNQVELYKAEWTGEEVKAKTYSAFADAIRSYVMGQQAAVEAFGKQVDSNNTILQGWAIEWDAYLKRLKPAELRIAAYEARSGHFGRLVQEYQAMIQSEGTRVDSDIKIEGLELQAMGQRLEEYKALWAGISAKLDALTKVYGTDAQVYQAMGQVEASRVGSLLQGYSVDVQRAGVELQRGVAGLQNRLGYWDRWMQSWVGWNSASAAAFAQMAGSAYSAANYTMSASGSTGFSSSWSQGDSTNTNYNYNMTG